MSRRFPRFLLRQKRTFPAPSANLWVVPDDGITPYVLIFNRSARDFTGRCRNLANRFFDEIANLFIESPNGSRYFGRNSDDVKSLTSVERANRHNRRLKRINPPANDLLHVQRELAADDKRIHGQMRGCAVSAFSLDLNFQIYPSQ
jgi:hypothetical protein